MNITDAIYDIVRNESARNNLDPALVLALIETESSFNPNAINPTDPSYGIMQIKLTTAREVTGNPTLTIQDIMNPALNIELGVRYLAQKISQSGGSIYEGLKAYKGIKVNVQLIDNVMNRIPYYQSFVSSKEQSMPNVIASTSDFSNTISDAVSSLQPSNILIALSVILLFMFIMRR